MTTRHRIRQGCSIEIDGQYYPAGTEIDPGMLAAILEPVPQLDLQLRTLRAHRYVEFSGGGIRPVSRASYATTPRAAHVTIGSRGNITARHAAQVANDGSAELERRLALADDTDGRVRVNPYFVPSEEGQTDG